MEQRSWIDDLVSAKVLMFMLLFMFIYLGVVLIIYPFLLEVPFKSVTQRELAAFQSLLGVEAVSNTIVAWGDWGYDGTFVTTGAERAVYGWVQNPNGFETALSSRYMAMMADNLFDYLLTVSYRLSFLVLLWIYLGIFVVCTVIHALIGRVRARYTFGDTPLLANIYARGVTIFSASLTFIVMFWPSFVHPLVQASMLTGTAVSIAFFWVSLPKSA